MKIYLFGWPGALGGATTKLAHLVRLLRTEFDLMVVAPRAEWEGDVDGQRRLKELDVPFISPGDLCPRLTGWAVALCNPEFLGSGLAAEVRRRGLRIAWSNEMMWLFKEEWGALTLGLIDAILYVSQIQRKILEPQYRRILSGELLLRPSRAEADSVEGKIENSACGTKSIRWILTGNYIDPSEFPFFDRELVPRRYLTVGRVSRPDPGKFCPRFPIFYEGLGLRTPRFRVMGWSEEVARLWPGYRFDERWELLPACAEDCFRFLQSLDLFVYTLGPTFRESWGRVVAEAMLTGAVPLVPGDEQHHLCRLVPHGHAGFVCRDEEDFGRYARLLENDPALRHRFSRQARSWAMANLCNADDHQKTWRRVFYGGI